MISFDHPKLFQRLIIQLTFSSFFWKKKQPTFTRSGQKTEPNRVKPNQPNRNQFKPNRSLFQTIRLKISLIWMVWFGSI